jgi:hypothetical protein
MNKTLEVLSEVAEERERQNAKWGEQNHPNGTGADQIMWPAVAVKTKSYGAIANAAKAATDTAAEYGAVTYADILVEEVLEALAEEDPAKLRAELVQVAAVATQWVEAIDRGTK